MDKLPPGVAHRLRQLEAEDDDDEFECSAPTTRVANGTSSLFYSDTHSHEVASSASNAYASEPRRSFAPAFTPLRKKEDPYEISGQTNAFLFSTAISSEPQAPKWNSYDPHSEEHRQRRGHNHQNSSRGSSHRSHSVSGSLDTTVQRNQALEGTFRTDSAIRVTNEISASTSDFDHASPSLDPRLENPNLDIDPNVRANFVTLDRLYDAPVHRSVMEMRNPTLMASRANTAISTVIGGELITVTPKPIDKRLRHLDRHGEYVGEDMGQIAKRKRRQYIKDVAERDRQMLQATAEYRALAAMGAGERTELLERLRKPLVFYGAFQGDQEELSEFPGVYTRSRRHLSRDIITWMGESASEQDNVTQRDRVRSSNNSPPHSVADTSDTFIPIEYFDDEDNLAANRPIIPLTQPALRTQRYFQDALHYGRKLDSFKQPNQKGASHSKPREPSSSNKPTTASQSSPHNSISTPGSTRTLISSLGYEADPGEVRSLYANPSSHNGDLFTFDDSPEFQPAQDVATLPLTATQSALYTHATTISTQHGRVLLLRLHEPVRFTPGAITSRICGSAIQETQLFPTQRLAIVIFLHPADARSFLRHVTKTYENGSAHEIRALQLEAGWYGGEERAAVLPAQSGVLTHFLARAASRSLRLACLPVGTTPAGLAGVLAAKLRVLLLRVVLRTPRQAHLRRRGGRSAVVEFACMADAIMAFERLTEGGLAAVLGMDGFVGRGAGAGGDGDADADEDEDAGADVSFVPDGSEELREEKAWCTCRGCKMQREERRERRAMRAGSVVGEGS